MTHRPYRITDVTVVDPRDGAHATHVDLDVVDGRIRAMTAAGGRTDRDVVEGRGRFVVPGYVDMHVHALTMPDPDRVLTAMLAFGITGYRQMGGSPALLARRRAGRLETDATGPRLLATPGSLLTPLNAATPRAGVAEARRQARAGADFLKAGLITPEVYFAVQHEADRLGIPVCGHLPAGIDVRAAASAGFRSVEHVGPGLGVLAGCSCHEQQFLAGRPRAVRRLLGTAAIPPIDLSSLPVLDRLVARLLRRVVRNPALLVGRTQLAAMRRALDTFDEDRARDLARHFAAEQTWHCPTLIRVATQELCDAPGFAADPNLRLVPPRERDAWRRSAERFRTVFDADARAVLAEHDALLRRTVGILAREGVPLLAGTDAGGAVWVVPGSSLHDEFDLLAGAGLDPLSILRSTTTEPARFLNRLDRAGTVEVGKDADLVLLDGDPTVSVAGLHGVSGVVTRGRYLSRADLEGLKDRCARWSTRR